MTDTLFRNLIFFRAKQKELKAHIQAIEEGMAPLKEQLLKAELAEAETELKVIEAMKKEGVKTKMYEGQNITQSERRTMKIVDQTKVLNALTETHISKLKSLVGTTYEELRKSLIKPAELNTKKAREFIDILTKVEDVKVEGTEVQVTEYLTIK